MVYWNIFEKCGVEKDKGTKYLFVKFEMLNVLALHDKYYLQWDKNDFSFWPFESVWAKGKFFGEEFKLDTKGLETWKDAVGLRMGELYFFEMEWDVIREKG